MTMLPPSHPYYGLANVVGKIDAQEAQAGPEEPDAGVDDTEYAVIATCTSDDRITVQHFSEDGIWEVLAAWIDRQGYHGYTGVGRRRPGPPPYAEVDLISGGDLMERLLIVPAAALEGCSS